MPKTVNLDLVDIDGNAFAILGVFKNQAKREGWTPEEVETVINKAMEGNYNHLLSTILEHCDPSDEEECDGCGELLDECEC